ALPTLWIVGDSTVHNGKPEQGLFGWGDSLGELFDLTKINVVNRARGGRSSRTFISEGLWDSVMAPAHKGDFVLLQFGHNDWSPIDEKTKFRGSLRGTGDETKDVFNDLTNKQETVHSYGWYMRKMIDDAKAKGMTAIVCSPVPRLPSKDGAPPTSEATSYQEWAEETAKAEGVAYVNLFQFIWKKWAGRPASEIRKQYFTDADNTHTNAVGAKVNAACVVEGLKALKDDPLAAYLK
ncbi:MAG: hypothetical protein JWM57_827, partial [Phycisphaerales bacterium]|nr:hypothetical protein [Phycisphaerales bacterium]